MLLEDYSENGLSPVMDGLVCWFDAKDGENGINQIKDRTQYNNILTLDNFTWDSSNGFDKNILKITKEQTVRSLIDSSTFDIDNCTIEYHGKIYWSSPRSHDELIFSLNPTTQFVNLRFYSIGSNGNKFIAIAGNYVINPSFNLQNCIGDTLSIIISKSSDNDGYYYINNQKFIFNTTNIKREDSKPYDLYFGENNSVNAYKVVQDFHSIRIYNRVLTEEEIQENYLYEQSINRGE